jgi:S1-C subfamily serine protease
MAALIVSCADQPVVRELIAKGRIFYANDLPIERGALVVRLQEGGPARRAGFEAGDVFAAVDGRPPLEDGP